MKILCLCNQGNNRSVQFAHLLRYWRHDTLPAGTETNSPETLAMLCNWADVIITTDTTQIVPDEYKSKVKLWDVGKDSYPRPFNDELNEIARDILNDNESWLKPQSTI